MTDFLKVKTYSISPMGFNLGSMKMVAFSRLSFRKRKQLMKSATSATYYDVAFRCLLNQQRQIAFYFRLSSHILVISLANFFAVYSLVSKQIESIDVPSLSAMCLRKAKIIICKLTNRLTIPSTTCSSKHIES